MYLPSYRGLQHHAESTLAESFRIAAGAHRSDAAVHDICDFLATQSDHNVSQLDKLVRRYGERPQHEPERLLHDGLSQARTGPLGLLRDLQDLYLLASFADITWTMLVQSGHALADQELLDIAHTGTKSTAQQLRWLRTIMSQIAPQALIAQ